MKKELNILILEDLTDDIGLVERALTKGGMHFRLTRVDSREDFISHIKNNKYDVILSDHSLPAFNSKEALKIYKSHKLEIPFILVTGTVSEEFAVSCLKEGADNYVLKSNLGRLPLAIINAIRQRNGDKKRKEIQRKLRRQNAELKKINSELDAFVYNVSHHLRAPILSTIGLLKLAKIDLDKADISSMQMYYEKMEESVLKLDQTLKEILDYSRNARGELQRNTINFQALIDDNLDKVKYLPHYDSIEKIISIDENVPFHSDQHRLNIIFENLISNAIKYCDAYKQQKWVRIEITSDEKHATISVEDNGIGISKDHLSNIFSMFFRATEKSKGSGLGLYIVKEIVVKLHGHIDVTSESDQGTKLTIVLPNMHEQKQ